jgi:hypothetical protein
MWNNFLSFINSNNALWSFLVTIATIVYVILTYQLLKESILARKSQTQPYIIADIERMYLVTCKWLILPIREMTIYARFTRQNYQGTSQRLPYCR